MVEVAAISVTKGNIDSAAPFVARVNPGLPIPRASTAIHHINDEMVASAPTVAQVLPRLQAAVTGRLLIGHAIGFDLAVLRHEAHRAGIPWRKPRSLCVRTLAMIAAPDLASHSLDGIAQWLGIGIANRHSALGDAEAAARIFLALVPLLEQRGIVTLAQAERACRQRSTERQTEAAVGWADPVGGPKQAPDILAGRLTFAYRHLVEELMAAPAVVVADAEPLAGALKTMVERNISSVLVAADPVPGQPIGAYGIVTERDVLRSLATDGAGVLQKDCGTLASRPLHSIRAKAFAYRAIGRMTRLGIRHLAVRSDNGLLVGVVSARGLLRAQGGPAVALEDAIQVAEDAKALSAAWSTLPAVGAALVGADLNPRTVSGVISEEIRAMTRQSAILAERAMAEAGRGQPPVRFVLLVLGSGGRGESLLAPDQDNAIIFEAADAGPDSDIDRWFAEYGSRLSDILDEAGIPLCKGGVMARNPEWRGSADTWRDRIAGWISKSHPKDLLNVDIFFDMIPVHGDIDLGQQLFEDAYAAARGNPAFAKLLGDGLIVGDPFGVLGGLKLEAGRIDLKALGLFPIVKLARSLAIQSGLPLRSTSERLQALAERGGRADLQAFDQDHAVLLAALLKQQAADIEAGLTPGNRLDPRLLPKEQLGRLKHALRHVQSAPDVLRDLMF
jgi:DNA polymerase-3 subunit epsilon/CBS domain-containing protein